VALTKRLGNDSLLKFEIIEGSSVVGGGSAPTMHPKTVLIALTHSKLSPDELETDLRKGDPPVIGRISNNSVVLDLRTVFESDEGELLDLLIGI
jgi:L-seryl-tRNA(Ser) seleniumtransferase